VRPLDPLTSIKTKLGVVIVCAVAVTVVVHRIGLKQGLPLAVVGVASGALALGMVQLLAHGMTSPLREMAAAAKAMAKGDYSRRVTATSRDEVGDLASAFNAMSAELAEVDRMRKDLVANVSHELRTPIGALQAMLENLVDGVQPTDPAALATMLKQVERLGRLVEQLLDLSRLESGALALDVAPFDVGRLLEDAAGECRLVSGRTSVHVTIDQSGLAVEGDTERIHQVVANLLENAVRHSADGGDVHLSAHERDDRLRIEVTDSGPGIPDAEASRVFERFYRSDSARSSMDGGSGLGLAIARWIVDLHGGKIWVESPSEGGCRMVVELPVRSSGFLGG